MERSEITEAPTDISRVAKASDGGITMENGWSIGCVLSNVQVGDLVEQWGQGIGFPVRGLAVGGRVAWYRTEAEEEAHRARLRAEWDEERRIRFEEQRSDLDAQFAALPAVFQERIAQFRERGGDQWRVDHESYEMFCCTEAVKIAEWCLTNGRTIGQFREMSHAEQVAAGLSDGHSGNTFGVACQLARLWPIRTAVLDMPGALSPIAGAEASGHYSQESV